MEQINPLYDGSNPEENIQEQAAIVNETILDGEQSAETVDVVDEGVRRDLGATSIIGAQESELTERKTLPPVESVPSLFELGVKGPDSLHQHKYDQTNTVWRQVSKAEDTPKSERTYQQAELLADVKRLEAYAPYTSSYMDVFNPEELHALVGKLDLLSEKNRPDFNAIEAKIIDVVIRNADSIGGDIVGIARRAEQNADGRRGMQWATLNKLAGVANDALVQSMFKGDDRARYIVPIDRDPDYDKSDKKSVDLKNVYQFVATSHAFDMYGERSIDTRAKRLQTFTENYDIITKWYAEAKAGIDQLPTDRDFADSLDNRVGYRRKPARSGIQYFMTKLMEAMEKRYEGNESFGKFKSYRSDPAGAINLQLMIAHKVEAIREKLGAGIHPADQEITPLEDFEF